QGMYTAFDTNGTLSGFTNRNGNLQLAQFYYGASQPNSAHFYTAVQDGAADQSSFNVLGGDLTWSEHQGDGSGVAVDQTGSGTLYEYLWPCCGGNYTNFFQVNGTGRTFGLLQGGDVPLG